MLRGKLMKCWLDEQTVRCTENWLNNWAQRVVINGIKSSWRSVINSVPQRSILNLILFNIFIFDLDDGGWFALTEFADNAQQGGVADSPEGHAAIQQDLNRMEKGADRNIRAFNR